MKRKAAALIALLAMPVASAGDAQSAPDCFPFSPGCGRLPGLLDDLTRDLAPLVNDLAARLDPYLRQLTDLMGDLSGWEAPEVLPNGDILIRRRPAAPESPGQPGDAPVTDPFEL